MFLFAAGACPTAGTLCALCHLRSRRQVFASCSVDKTVQVWDARNFGSSMITVKVHDVDVNVMSWNSLVPFLLVTGADDGSFKVWDFRSFKAYVAPAESKGGLSHVHMQCLGVPYVYRHGARVCVCLCVRMDRDSPLAHFRWHRKPITSVEWRPDDENEIVVTSADNTV